VYTMLSALLREGGLRPGDRVRELDIARRFRVSRTPVREAVRRLEAEGILTSAPRRGLIVTKLDPYQVAELYALREILEGFAARSAAQFGSEGEVSGLRSLVARQGGLKDANALSTVNRQFHQVIYGAARNRYLLSVLNSLRDSLALLPGTTYGAASRPRAALKEHLAIVRAIEQRDGPKAEETARAHVRAGFKIRQTMAETLGNF